MSKSFWVMLLAVAGAVLWTDGADARGRRGCGNQRNAWSTTAPMTMVGTPQTAPTVAQSNTGSNYQSYSYEPSQNNASQPANAAPVAAYRAPLMARQSNSFEYNNVIRGDRKARGHTAEGE